MRARKRKLRRYKSRSPGLRRRSRGTGAFASVFVGICFGGLVMVTGFFSPSHYSESQSALFQAALARQQRAGLGDSHYRNHLSRAHGNQGLFSFENFTSLFPGGIDSLVQRSGLANEALAYQEGRCDVSCKAKIKNKLAASLGPNWRTVVDRYKPMISSLQQEMSEKGKGYPR